MPRYVVIEAFCLGRGRGDVYPGDVLDLSEEEASTLLRQARIAAEPQTSVAPEHRDPRPVHQEPKTVRRSKRT